MGGKAKRTRLNERNFAFDRARRTVRHRGTAGSFALIVVPVRTYGLELRCVVAINPRQHVATGRRHAYNIYVYTPLERALRFPPFHVHNVLQTSVHLSSLLNSFLADHLFLVDRVKSLDLDRDSSDCFSFRFCRTFQSNVKTHKSHTFRMRFQLNLQSNFGLTSLETFPIRNVVETFTEIITRAITAYVSAIYFGQFITTKRFMSVREPA